MDSDFELTNKIVNGYWYTFIYDTGNGPKTDGYDDRPLVYCYAPSEKNLNCFWGINLHHIGNKKARLEFVELLQKDKFFMNDEVRHFWYKEDLKRISEQVFNESNRCYDKRKCREVYRIKNGELGKYILTDGDLVRSNPSQEEIKWNLEHRNMK